VIAPRKREASKPRLLTFSIVTDERLEELLMITILPPVFAIFSTNKIKILKEKKTFRACFIYVLGQ
jgi:hypothetical protein